MNAIPSGPEFPIAIIGDIDACKFQYFEKLTLEKLDVWVIVLWI